MSFRNTDLTAAVEASHHVDCLRQKAEMLPRSVRFLGVGSIGLIVDLGILTMTMALGPKPLVARVLSLAVATLVTWRLNRALTFDCSGRSQSQEAGRYLIVTLVAQGASYAIFAALVLTALHGLPQAAALVGAAAAAAVSYNGHRLFAFASNRSEARHEYRR